jgi:hypothetical protein
LGWRFQSAVWAGAFDGFAHLHTRPLVSAAAASEHLKGASRYGKEVHVFGLVLILLISTIIIISDTTN